MQHPLGDVRAPSRGGEYRPSHELLGSAIRAVPTQPPPPPTSAAYHHSRTPSLATSQPTPPQRPTVPKAGLHSNPFATMHPPGSAARADPATAHARYPSLHGAAQQPPPPDMDRVYGDRPRDAPFERRFDPPPPPPPPPQQQLPRDPRDLEYNGARERERDPDGERAAAADRQRLYAPAGAPLKPPYM